MASERSHASGYRPNEAAVPAVEQVAQFYKLTTAERRVLSAILETGGVRSVAAALGISQATVKTHLQNIFGKTGARRQIDLVRLVIASSAGDQGREPPPHRFYVPTS